MIKHADGSVTLTPVEYERVVIRLACGEYGKTEEEMFAWVHDDENLTWQDSEPDYTDFDYENVK